MRLNTRLERLEKSRPDAPAKMSVRFAFEPEPPLEPGERRIRLVWPTESRKPEYPRSDDQ